MTNENQQPLSDEELEFRKAEMEAFYDKQKQLLIKQRDHAKLLYEIDKYNFKRNSVRVKHAQLVANQNPNSESDKKSEISNTESK